MRHNQLSLEKYFDDGVVQYWRPINKDRYYIQYRLTVEPTWISIDTLRWSWNNRRCWRTIYPNITTMDEATRILETLLFVPTLCRQDLLVKEGISSQWSRNVWLPQPELVQVKSGVYPIIEFEQALVRCY